MVEQACAAGPELLGTNLANVAPGVDCQSMRLPLGVCACVCPQLFPAMLPLWTMPLAIVAGNSVVLKPSEVRAARAGSVERLLGISHSACADIVLVATQGLLVQVALVWMLSIAVSVSTPYSLL